MYIRVAKTIKLLLLKNPLWTCPLWTRSLLNFVRKKYAKWIPNNCKNSILDKFLSRKVNLLGQGPFGKGNKNFPLRISSVFAAFTVSSSSRCKLINCILLTEIKKKIVHHEKSELLMFRSVKPRDRSLTPSCRSGNTSYTPDCGNFSSGNNNIFIMCVTLHYKIFGYFRITFLILFICFFYIIIFLNKALFYIIGFPTHWPR